MSEWDEKINKKQKNISIISVIMILYFYIYFVLILGSILCDISSCEYIIDEIEKFFTYDVEGMQVTLITIWSVVIAIITYYLGRKEEKSFGVHNGEIVKACFSKAICCFFLMMMLQLLLLIMNSWRQLPITLLVSAVLMWILASSILIFTPKITEPTVLLAMLEKEICKEQKRSVDVSYDTFLYTIIKNLNYKNEEEQLFLVRVLKQLYIQFVKEKRADWQWKNITLLILEGCPEEKEFFFQRLVGEILRAEDFSEDEKERQKLLSFTIVPILYHGKYKMFIDCLGIIEDYMLRNIIVLQGLFYRQFLYMRQDKEMIEEEVLMFCNQLRGDISCENMKDKLNEFVDIIVAGTQLREKEQIHILGRLKRNIRDILYKL